MKIVYEFQVGWEVQDNTVPLTQLFTETRNPEHLGLIVGVDEVLKEVYVKFKSTTVTYGMNHFHMLQVIYKGRPEHLRSAKIGDKIYMKDDPKQYFIETMNEDRICISTRDAHVVQTVASFWDNEDAKNMILGEFPSTKRFQAGQKVVIDSDDEASVSEVYTVAGFDGQCYRLIGAIHDLFVKHEQLIEEGNLPSQTNIYVYNFLPPKFRFKTSEAREHLTKAYYIARAIDNRRMLDVK